MQELKISEENLEQKEDVDKGKNVNKCYLSLSKYYFPRNVTSGTKMELWSTDGFQIYLMSL